MARMNQELLDFLKNCGKLTLDFQPDVRAFRIRLERRNGGDATGRVSACVHFVSDQVQSSAKHDAINAEIDKMLFMFRLQPA